MKRSHKIWVSPIIAISSVVTSTTGILLFFHIKNGVIFSLHEWIGWTFVIISILHLVLNWKTFACYFKKKAAYISLIAISLITLTLAVSELNNTKGGGKHGRPHSQVITSETTIENSDVVPL